MFGDFNLDLPIAKTGGGEGTRTPDPLRAKQML